jgi:hypothetical protein
MIGWGFLVVGEANEVVGRIAIDGVYRMLFNRIMLISTFLAAKSMGAAGGSRSLAGVPMGCKET